MSQKTRRVLKDAISDFQERRAGQEQRPSLPQRRRWRSKDEVTMGPGRASRSRPRKIARVPMEESGLEAPRKFRAISRKWLMAEPDRPNGARKICPPRANAMPELPKE